MAEAAFKVNPPDLGEIDALAQFPLDADLVNPDYAGFAYSDRNWTERSHPAIRFEAAFFKNMVLSRTKMRSAAFEDVRFTSCDASSADWTVRNFPGSNSCRPG